MPPSHLFDSPHTTGSVQMGELGNLVVDVYSKLPIHTQRHSRQPGSLSQGCQAARATRSFRLRAAYLLYLSCVPAVPTAQPSVLGATSDLLAFRSAVSSGSTMLQHAPCTNI